MMSMTRRSLLGGAAAFAASALGAPDRRPNIVFLLADDQRWDTLGCMGNHIIRTPNIDRLSQQGVTFQNNFCATAICCTSRASVFTGLYEKSHGITDFSTALSPRIHAQSYPVLLKKAGYRTGFVGKYGVGNDMPASDYDYWQGLAGQGGTYWHEWKGKRTHLTRMMGEQALEFLEGSGKSQPFCLNVSFKAPHAEDPNPKQYIYDPVDEGLYNNVTIPTPKTAAPEYFEALPEFLKTSEGRVRWGWRFTTPESYQEMVKGYYRLISGIDAVVGKVVKKLEQMGVADNTVIVYTSDNGYFLAEHGLADKWFMLEESIRTPLIVYDPRLAANARGKRRSEMTLNVDLAPTLLSIAGVEAPGSMQGRSFMPLVAGGSQQWRSEWFYSHHFKHPRIPMSEGIRDGRWKFVRYLEKDYEELYDLREDPMEIRNLHGQQAAAGQEERLRTRWKTWNKALEAWTPDSLWREP